MRLNQPKSRAKPEESPTKANQGPKPEAIAYGHPIFGTAPVAVVTVARLRYRNGDPKLPPIRTPLQPIAPERLIDLGAVGTIYGPGRYDLRAVDERGVLAWRPETVDCPDEEGNLHLVAPMPPPDANAPASGGTPAIQKDLVDIYKDIASQAEKSRANDFQAFVKIMEAQNAGRASGGGSELVAFLQGELQGARARCVDLEARLESARETIQRLREQSLRSKSSEGTEDLIGKFGSLVMDRIKATGAAAATGSSTGAATDGVEFRLPSAEELAAMLHAGAVPSAVISHAVKLHRAGGLAPDLWALVEPVASLAGLL